MGERESGSRRCGPAALTSAVLGVDPCCSSLRATAAVFLLAALSARKNSPEVAQLLCEHDADVNDRSSKDGWSALHCACDTKNVDVAKVLVDYKDDLLTVHPLAADWGRSPRPPFSHRYCW